MDKRTDDDSKKPVVVRPPQTPKLDFGIEGDRSIGELLADAKIAEMKRAFDERYQSGVSSLIQPQTDFKSDAAKGEEVANILLEGKRRALVSIALHSGLFSVVAITAGTIVGLPIVLSCLFIAPAVLLSIVLSRR